MWRWGWRDAGWNEIVDGYNAVRSFDIGHPDFEVRLDYTNGYNERGWAKHSETYLDSVLAYLVYYRGKHVMTLGFSILGSHRLAIQQVQLTQRKGNRFLYRLPANYVEFFVSRFAAAFPGYTLFMADGEDVARFSLDQYKAGLKKALTELARVRKIKKSERTEWDIMALECNLERKERGEIKVQHLTEELPRIKAMYANTGRYHQGEVLVSNDRRHYRLELSN